MTRLEKLADERVMEYLNKNPRVVVRDMAQYLFTAGFKAAMEESQIFENRTDTPILIITKWSRDLLGGPAIRTQEIMIAPGQAVNMRITGLTIRALGEEDAP